MPALLSFSDSETSSPPPGAPQPHAPSASAAAKDKGKATSRPLKRAAPRFLGDEDDDGVALVGGRLTSKFKTTAADVDRLFAGLEAEDDDDDGLQLPPRLQRGSQHSVIDDSIDALGGRKSKKAKNGDGDELDDKIDADGEKKRKAPRKRALMNEERLRGERGLKKLKESLKGFKSKGKGHEADDLRRLMTVYQLWAHQMFPVGNFRDTIEKVEQLTSKKSIKYELKVWRDEARGIFLPKAGDSEADIDMEAALDVEAAENAEAAGPSTSQAGSPDPERPKKSYFDDIPTSSPGGGLSRDAEMGDDVGEMDEIEDALFGPASQAALRTEADMFAPAAGPSRAATSEAGFDDAELQAMTFDLDDGPDDFDMEAEAEAAMREMEAMGSGPRQPKETDMQRAAKAREAAASGAQKEHKPISFYADAKAVPKPAAAAQSTKVTTTEDEDNFDDFDFGDEEDMMREMQKAEAEADRRMRAEAAQEPKAVAAALSKTPSLSTGTDSFDLEDDLELDDDFLRSVNDAEQEAITRLSQAPALASSPVKAGEAAAPAPVVFEEEEDLYS